MHDTNLSLSEEQGPAPGNLSRTILVWYKHIRVLLMAAPSCSTANHQLLIAITIFSTCFFSKLLKREILSTSRKNVLNSKVACRQILMGCLSSGLTSCFLMLCIVKVLDDKIQLSKSQVLFSAFGTAPRSSFRLGSASVSAS